MGFSFKYATMTSSFPNDAQLPASLTQYPGKYLQRCLSVLSAVRIFYISCIRAPGVSVCHRYEKKSLIAVLLGALGEVEYTQFILCFLQPLCVGGKSSVFI